MNQPTGHFDSERSIALVLRLGAYGSLVILLLAAVLAALRYESLAILVAKSGILLLLATPTVRVVAALWMFIQEKDTRMIAVSFGVLLIILISSFLGVKLH